MRAREQIQEIAADPTAWSFFRLSPTLESFLKGQIRLCQETSLYARIPDAANEAITKHIIECVGEFAMFGEFSEVGNELISDSFFFLLSAEWKRKRCTIADGGGVW